MSWISVLAARLRGIFGKQRFETDLDEEVHFHLDMLIEDNLAAGMDPAEARYDALRRFGPVELMKEQYRERLGLAFMDALAQDIRYALRTLRKSRGFATTTVAVLALAIGANTAMFSVLNAVLIRPLPYRSPEQLAMLWTERPTQNIREGRSGYWNVEQWRNQSRTFADIAAFDPASVMLMTSAGAERVSLVRTSYNFFSLLGVHPARGRVFSVREQAERQHVALISHRFWLSHFGGSPAALGASIDLDGFPSRIVGVLPDGFAFPFMNADIWEPATTLPDWDAKRAVRGPGSWFVVGRLRPNVTLREAQAEMSTIAHRLDEHGPSLEEKSGISVVPLHLEVTGPRSRLSLWMLMGAVLTVLLIAATNVASLAVARNASREREIAIRIALGANRARIVRQLLTENLTLAAFAGVLGLAVAVAATDFVRMVQPEDVARLREVSVDARVLAATFLLSLLAGVLVGMAPAITATRQGGLLIGPEGGRNVAGGRASRRIRRGLIVTQFALAIVLLVGAGLFIRSLWSIENVQPGFRPDGILSVQMASPGSRPAAERAAVYDRILEQVASVPGVVSAGIIGDFFISGSPEQIVTTEGVDGVSQALRFRRDEVSADFFKTAGTPPC